MKRVFIPLSRIFSFRAVEKLRPQNQSLLYAFQHLVHLYVNIISVYRIGSQNTSPSESTVINDVTGIAASNCCISFSIITFAISHLAKTVYKNTNLLNTVEDVLIFVTLSCVLPIPMALLSKA